VAGLNALRRRDLEDIYYLGIAEKAIRRQVQGKDKKQTS
jgi:hypothetical protein